MLTIKLQRIGKKHQPTYRVVVAEKRSKMGAPPVEDLGSFNPFTKAFSVKKERVEYWIRAGAQPTATAHNLLVSYELIRAKKIAVKMKKPEAKAVPTVSSTQPESAEASQPAETAPVEATEAAPSAAEAPEEVTT